MSELFSLGGERKATIGRRERQQQPGSEHGGVRRWRPEQGV